MKGKGKIIAVIVVIVVLVIVFRFGCSNKKTNPNLAGSVTSPTVQVEVVKKGDIAAKITSSGTLEAVETKSVFLDGPNKVIALNYEAGDFVNQGDVLLTLDQDAQTSIQNQIAVLEKQLSAEKESLASLKGKGSEGEILNAKAQLSSIQDSKKSLEQNIADSKKSIESLKKDLASRQSDLETAKEMLEQGFGTQKEVDDLQKAIDDIQDNIDKAEDAVKLSEDSSKTIDAQIKTAQYNVDLLENNVSTSSKQASIAAKESQIKSIENQIAESKKSLSKEKTQILAPISGVITQIPTDEGMAVAAGTPLVTILNPNKLQVKCDVSTYYAPDLKVGLPVEVKYTGSKTVEVIGTITKVSPIAVTTATQAGEKTNIPIEIEIENPGEILKAGLSVDVKIIIDERTNVCLVPILAIEEVDDMSYVYVVDDKGLIQKREIQQGLSDGLYIEATGVNEGDIVITSIDDNVADGKKVSYEKIEAAMTTSTPEATDTAEKTGDE